MDTIVRSIVTAANVMGSLGVIFDQHAPKHIAQGQCSRETERRAPLRAA